MVPDIGEQKIPLWEIQGTSHQMPWRLLPEKDGLLEEYRPSDSNYH